MSKRRKPQQNRPDEAFEFGPIRIARFGKNVIWQSNWPEGKFEEFQQRAIERLPEVTKEIDELAAQIAELVRVLPAHKLLHRAWWEMAGKYISIQSEVEVDTEGAIAMRMIDYVQSVVASVAPAEEQHDDVTEDEWKSLTSKVEALFRTLNIEYQICRTAHNKANDADFDEDFEEFSLRRNSTGRTFEEVDIKFTKQRT